MIDILTTTKLQFDLDEIKRIGGAIVDTLGEDLCEVVLHDFSRDDDTIVWIKGRVTNRQVGGSLSQIGLAIRSQGEEAEDQVNYTTRTKDGKLLKSTTTILRDAEGMVFGLFCINFDLTSLALAQQALNSLLETDETKLLTNIHFSNNLADVAQTILDEVIKEQNLTGFPTEVSGRRKFIHALDARGFFAIRHSVSLLSEYLGVSRGSIYNYMKDAE